MANMADRGTFDRVLFDPSAAELDAALKGALKGANEGNDSKSKHIKWPPADLAKFREQLAATPEGQHGWHGGSKPKYFAGKSQIIAAWWTDMLGRKHVRMMGGHGITLCDRLHITDNGQPTRMISGYVEVLYADHVARVSRAGGKASVVGVCDCGAIGSFAALGWTGPCCGPCHDHRLEGHRSRLLSWETGVEYGPALTFDPAGGALFYARGGLHRIDLETGAVEPVPHPSGIGSCWRMTFLPGGKRAVLFGSKEQHEEAVAVWESGTTALSEWHLSTDYRTALCLSPGGDIIAVSHMARDNGQRKLNLRSVHDGKVLRQLGRPDINEMLFSPDGRLLLVISYGAGPKVWDTKTGKLLHTAPNLGQRHPVFGRDGRAIYALSEDVAAEGTAHDAGGVPMHVLKYPGSHMTYSLGFTTVSPDGKVLVAGIGGALYFWEVTPTGVGTWTAFRTAHETFHRFAWSPDGRWLATGDRKGTVRLWPWPAVCEAARSAETG